MYRGITDDDILDVAFIIQIFKVQAATYGVSWIQILLRF